MSTEQSERTEALVGRLFTDLLGTITTYGVYLGDRLGLYRAMADGMPVTAPDLAARSGIATRYAREWLEAQSADGILELHGDAVDPDARRFVLPAGHADVLANADSDSYFTPFMGLLVASAVQLPAIIQAYRTGGGVPWATFGDEVREAQGAANRPLFLNQLASQLLPQIADVDARLRRPGTRVAEIGSGMGWASIAIAEGYPGVKVDGFDIDAPSVEQAKHHAALHGVADRVHFHAEDAAEASGRYDVVFAFECVHDMPQPVPVLATMRRLAGDDGTVIVMDEAVGESFTAPASEVDRMFYGYSLLVCLPDGMSHQPSAATGTVMRPSKLREYATQAGFRDVDVLPIANDFFRFYRLVR